MFKRRREQCTVKLSFYQVFGLFLFASANTKISASKICKKSKLESSAIYREKHAIFRDGATKLKRSLFKIFALDLQESGKCAFGHVSREGGRRRIKSFLLHIFMWDSALSTCPKTSLRSQWDNGQARHSLNLSLPFVVAYCLTEISPFSQAMWTKPYGSLHLSSEEKTQGIL